jgi:endonuclease/exonuclease/phosphatase (EEP) superfamily protein YafD
MVAGLGSKVRNISWVVAGGLAAWAAVRVTAADRVRRVETPAVPFLSFTPQVAAAAPWAALGLRLAGRRGPAATAALAAAALGLVVRPRRIPRPQPGASGPLLRVLTVNVFFGRADAEVIVARVRQADVDVLFLQELTTDAVTLPAAHAASPPATTQEMFLTFDPRPATITAYDLMAAEAVGGGRGHRRRHEDCWSQHLGSSKHPRLA